jgi:hypothetical protein
VTTCGCPEGDFFIELTVEGEIWRFTEPPVTHSRPDAPFYYPSCETFLSPAFFTGISCLPDAVAACDEAGDCLTIDHSLVLTAADGEVLLQREDLTPSPLIVDAEPGSPHRDVGVTLSGSIVVGEITGSFSLCVAASDGCLR